MKFIETYYKREDQPTSMRIGTVACVANAVFHFCDSCDELLMVTSENPLDLGKVAIFMKGDNLIQDDIDYLHGVSSLFIPLGILLVCFIVETVENIDTNKLINR